MMYNTIPLQLFAVVALLLASHDVEGFVPAPSVRGHSSLSSARSGRGATCSQQGVKPLSAGAMGENTTEEDKLKARAAFADSSLMDNLMSMLNQLKGFSSGGEDAAPAEAAAESSEGETAPDSEDSDADPGSEQAEDKPSKGSA